MVAKLSKLVAFHGVFPFTVLKMRSESGLDSRFPSLHLLIAVINMNQANTSLASDSHVKSIKPVISLAAHAPRSVGGNGLYSTIDVKKNMMNTANCFSAKALSFHTHPFLS